MNSTLPDTQCASDALAENGYVVLPNFLTDTDAMALYDYASNLDDAQWQIAAVGRQQLQTINTHVRSDKIHWLQPEHSLESAYLAHMDNLRLRINRELFMGLFDYESHLAKYRPGAYYKKHLDAFKGRSNRVLTTVLYLNPEWSDTDGGELVIYGTKGEVLEELLPTLGTMVMFLSDTFVHEVKVGSRERYSITGWFRHNTSISGIIDPPR
ncbi:2OG-Fe(II) oxygenase [Aliidiomarina minuta]|uniref:2OG-Fe(II) oxygenase n=1 Tax=Aliidiomarina minuta TaxID=880057 RepID=UPI001F53F34A|nr:2OG-Fe(II) oxygenase [Aliidiomarina minuta]